MQFLSDDQTRSLFRLFYYFLPYVAYQPEVTNHFDEEYDYIIAGGGSAGSVLASRLSEDPCVKVLLLEAGGKVDPNTEIPVIGILNQMQKNDWQFPTTPLKKSLAGSRNSQIMTMGKGFGGGSLLNYMMYVRGNKRDYDQWEENGATGWSWKDVYSYFLKSEDNTDPEILQNGYHSTGGFLTVGTPTDNSKIKDAFNAAGQELGYEYLDVNGAKQTCFAKMQGTIRNGRRCSTAKAFLIPAEDRPNLHIVNKAYVQKVLINNKKEAYGVRFEKGGDIYDIHARKEVIVSAGSFDSPKILMVSGIGPKDHLEDMNIKVIADLPVGNNLQNHVGNAVLKFTANTAQPVLPETDLLESAARYRLNATGPFTSLCGVEGAAFINTKYNDPELDWPDGEIYLNAQLPKIFIPDFEITDEEDFKKVYKDYHGDNSYLFFPTLLRPKSRGTVRLKSADPYAYPSIDFNMFEYDEDFEKVVDFMKQCVYIATNTTAFKKIGAKMSTKKMPGCKKYEIYSDGYLRCLAKKYIFNAYHPCCTCKMGDAGDETTVVDPQLRVKGIKNLRVVDGSIMPIIISGNLNAPIVMIAEKASDMIKKDNPDGKKCSVGDDTRIKRNRWKKQ